MLGMLRGHHGHHESSPSKFNTKEPVVTEIVPSPSSEKSNPNEHTSKHVDSVAQKPQGMLSPVPSHTTALQINKRQSSFQRTLGSVRASHGRFTNTLVREQHTLVLQKSRQEFGRNVGDHVFDTSFDGLLEWIRSERLIRLPNKGGSWDRVLIAAQYFAEQVHHFNRHITHFTEESDAATQFVYGQCLLLLELGHENSSALERAFELFYQFGLELSPLLKRAEPRLLGASHALMEGLSRAFVDLLQIVTGVAITFYQAVHSERRFTKLDIFASFSSIIQSFRVRVHQCAHEMWNVALDGHNTDGCHVDILQKWLAPKDSVLAFLSSNHINIACGAEEFTCTWFQTHLNTFLKSNKDILLVEGKSGSGKTTLANWTVDRLQRPIARKHVSTISFFFEYSIAAQSTPLAMLRTLLTQLLSTRIGNVELFEIVSQAYLDSSRLHTIEEQEKHMWQAISKALQAVSNEHGEPLIIIVDGITETDNVMKQGSKKLHDLVREYPGVRLIQFSQPLNHAPASSTVVTLSTENMLDDIRTLVSHRLHTQDHFKDREIGDQENIIDQIVTAAEGRMLWAYLTCKLLQRRHSCKDFDDTLKAVLTGSKTVNEIVKKLFTSLSLDDETKDFLSLLLTAERPLQYREAEALLQVDLKSHRVTDKTVKLQSICSNISAFTVVGEGLIGIRHDAIRQALLGLKDDSIFNNHLKNRQQDILERLLIYSKASLRAEHVPTFTCLDTTQLEHRLTTHILLEYAIRYWAVHFKKSPLFAAKGDLKLPKEFKEMFSSSVTFSLLEQACWDFQYHASEAIELHNLAFRVRKILFGENSPSVLQTAIFCAVLCHQVLSRHNDAVEWYALVSRIASTVVGVQAELTITSCNLLLRISETLITKKRTTVMTYREEVLLILVKSYQHRYGSSSKEVLEIYHKLEQLYIHLEEETKRTEIIAIIQKLTVVVYGEHSDEAKRIPRKAVVLLQHHEHIEKIKVRDGFLFFGGLEKLDIEFSIEIVAELLRQIEVCIKHEEYLRAEEIYIELWLKLNDHCKLVNTCLWHETKIDLMIRYAHFLEKRKRHTEVSAILVAIWTEYEYHEVSMSESIVILLHRVAVFMKNIQLFAMALLVFQKCLSYFSHHHEKHETTVIEIHQYILEITKTTTIITDKSSETVIRAVFELSITSSETVTITTVNLCTSLTLIYIKQERWSEAIRCIKQLLLKSWSSFFVESIDSILLAEHFSSESVQLVLHLAACFISLKKYERAEEIYIRLYRAYHRHCGISDAKSIEYREILVRFYDKYELFVKKIGFYQELLVEYRRCHGLDHKLTIELLYKLGAICRIHSTKYGYWLEYYVEIVVNLNKGRPICHHDAFDALVIVAEHYFESLRYSESLIYYRAIFKAFRSHGCQFHKYFDNVAKVEILLRHYFRAIEECSLDIKIHIQILENLRIAFRQFYGESHHLTIIVIKTLAETYYRNEKTQFNAIALWEFVSKETTTITKEERTRIELKLKVLYVKKATTTTVTHEELKKFTSLTIRLYREIREKHSCTEEVTMTCLKELVMLYCKQTKVEIELARKELKLILVDCLKQITVAKQLIEAATTIATIYISCGFTEEAFAIIHQFKYQIIYKVTDKTSHWGFDVTKLDHACFAFIATFEYYLHACRQSLGVYLSDLMAEYVFYRRFARSLEKKAELKVIFECGAWLRQVLVRTKRIEYFSFIEHKVFEYFVKIEQTVAKAVPEGAIKLFISVLLSYYSEHLTAKNFVAAAGYAALGRLRELIRANQHQKALDLATCTFKFLMAHEGLDDPTEIRLGFQLCLLIAGRTNHKELNQKSSNKETAQKMMALSREILHEVFDICQNSKYAKEIKLTSSNLYELNALIILVGEQQDYKTLQWLLELLWSSREAQSTWSPDVMLRLGRRLVQVQFANHNYTAAIRLCENIVYNVRRVHGLRHHYTVEFYALLASMYTDLAMTNCVDAHKDGNKNKKHSEEMARVYFKKAIHVHEEILKQIVNTDDADGSDCDDDESDYTAAGSDRRFGGLNGHANGHVNGHTVCGFAWRTQEQELQAVRAHVRRLQLAVQRHGGFVKDVSEYEKLLVRVWECYAKHPEFKLGEGQVLATRWKIDGFGAGKAEGELKEDGFKAPEVWYISQKEL